MNKKGLVFTLATLLMIVALISLNSTIKTISRESQDIGEISAIISTGKKMSNIERMIIDLDQENVIREINERILPFEYEKAFPKS